MNSLTVHQYLTCTVLIFVTNFHNSASLSLKSKNSLYKDLFSTPKIKSKRILGVCELTKPGEHNEFAQVLVRGKLNCGGAYIHPRYVITAAHCVTRHRLGYEVYPISWVSLVHGSSKVPVGYLEEGENKLTEKPVLSFDDGFGEQLATEIILHPDYETRYNETHKNDIALIRLTTPLSSLPANQRRSVQIIPILKEHLSSVPLGEKKEFFFLGHGECYKGILAGTQYNRKGSVIESSSENCEKRIKHFVFDKVTAICMEGVNCIGGCGDSGGPLVMVNEDGEKKLVGILSYGQLGLTDKDIMGTSNGRTLMVFSRLSHYIEWISNHIESNKHRRPSNKRRRKE